MKRAYKVKFYQVQHMGDQVVFAESREEALDEAIGMNYKGGLYLKYTEGYEADIDEQFENNHEWEYFCVNHKEYECEEVSCEQYYANI